jgi:probable addiction module antidote protein
MSKKSRPYRELLLERLGDPTIAAHYLDAAMEESQESYLKALRNVATAKQMAKVAKDTGVQRESLYRILSEQGNPTLETLIGIYDSIGLRLVSVPRDVENGGKGVQVDSLLESPTKRLSPADQVQRSISSAHTHIYWSSGTGLLNVTPKVEAADTVTTTRIPSQPTMSVGRKNEEGRLAA